MADKMRLAAVRIFVSDIAGACSFYRDQVGLSPSATQFDQGFAVFTLANHADLILEQDRPADDDGEGLVGRFVGASIGVDDIHEQYRVMVDRGVRFVATPEQQAWGGWLAHFFDPDDNIVTLLQHR